MSADRDPRPRPVVAVIDDDEAARASLGQMLRIRRMDGHAFSSAEAALAWPGLPDADCVISDVKMPGLDGEEFLAEMIRRGFSPPVILLTGHGDVAMAVRCLKAGAYDFVEKPFDGDVLAASVARAVEKSTLSRETARLRRRLEMLSPGEDGRFGMIGRSRVMQDLYQQIETVSRSTAPVLVMGETGSGKELVARAVHEQSPRAEGPFVAVNAGALTEALLEDELFGHARGAFTGAVASRQGKLVAAHGGTLLLDEIESLSLRAQIEMLRVVEDGLVQPLGVDTPRKSDVRVVATSKIEPAELVRLGRMREDFYHRIAVLTVAVPSLRERAEDIPLLVSHFLHSAARRGGIAVPKVAEQTLAELLRYPWPGNVRELKNVVERMVVTAQGGVTGLPPLDDSLAAGRLLSLPVNPGLLRDELENTEKTVIERVLRDNRGEINATWKALGISRQRPVRADATLRPRQAGLPKLRAWAGIPPVAGRSRRRGSSLPTGMTRPWVTRTHSRDLL